MLCKKPPKAALRSVAAAGEAGSLKIFAAAFPIPSSRKRESRQPDANATQPSRINYQPGRLSVTSTSVAMI
jgi:hypothetical protein